MEENKNENKVDSTSTKKYKSLAFALTQNVNTPKFIEKQSKGFVSAGKNNKWFQELVELLHSSNLHASVFYNLLRMIVGQGVKVKKDKPDAKLESFILKCNAEEETMNSLLYKIAFDDLLFGGHSIYVNSTKGNTATYLNHIDLTTLRCTFADVKGNVNSYLFSNDWFKSTPSTTEYPTYVSGAKNGIYYTKPYMATFQYYPLPSYLALIPIIEADYKIWQYRNASLDNSFSPSLWINYTNGIPPDEVKDQLYENLMESFQGTTNAGQVIMNWSENKESSPEFEVINNNDNDQKYLQLADEILKCILAGWSITSGELFSMPQMNKLGSGSILEAQDILQANSIRPRQLKLEESLNSLLHKIGFVGEIEIIPNEKVIPIDSPIISQTHTINEVREMLGKEPIEGGDVLITSSQPSQTFYPAPANKDENVIPEILN